jgi:hypothetical protein
VSPNLPENPHPTPILPPSQKLIRRFWNYFAILEVINSAVYTLCQLVLITGRNHQAAFIQRSSFQDCIFCFDYL